MELKIIDTTLRDGEQQAGLALGSLDKVDIAKLLDYLGVYQIEVGIPAMGGEEKRGIKKITALNLKSRISAWNRMSLKDINQSIECGVDVIHISVPSSDLQIREKLGKKRNWVINEMRKCIAYAREKGFIVNVGMEDASRADIGFMKRICVKARNEGVEMIRYADTVGILHPQRAFADISYLKSTIDIEMGIHTHNDFGMAIANALAAVEAGVSFVDCTIGGIGERTGNCNFYDFVKAIKAVLPGYYREDSTENGYELKRISEIEKEIRKRFKTAW